MVGMSKAKAENKALPKRFYTNAEARDGRILLDGKELKTQARNPLVLPAALADAVAAEWQAQQEVINPDRMPLTRLANLTIDRTPHDREAMIANTVAYAETDLLCYRDPALADRQVALFDPVLAWAAGQGVVLATTDSINPMPQPEASLVLADALLREATDAELTAIALMVPLLGSFVLGVALWKQAITLEQALEAARIDETVQAERWGADEEAGFMWEHKRSDIASAALFLTYKKL